MSHLDHLLCPIDQQPLTQSGRTLTCSANHSYDLAKTGYINLLPVQNKHSKDPGDSKAMVAARQNLLMTGVYDPIIQGVLDSMPEALTAKKSIKLLDAGCGEGYYLHWLKQALGTQLTGTGLDISKWAITSASKKSKDLTWVVGSNAHIPVASEYFDCVVCAFGFPVESEFSRVLQSEGWLLLVESGPQHLIELRNVLYPEIRPFKQTFEEGIAGFDLVQASSYQFQFHLDSQEQIGNLLSMTPHIHKAPYAGRQAALALTEIHLTADISLRWYKKQGTP